MKRTVFVIITILLTITLSGCKIKSYGKMKSVVYDAMLSQKDTEYYVFIYSSTCTVCEEIEGRMAEYANYAKKNSNAIPIYVLNISIKRLNGDIVGDSNTTYSFVGTADYKEVKIIGAPALVVVKNNRVTKAITSQTTNTPKTDILTLITSSMK